MSTLLVTLLFFYSPAARGPATFCLLPLIGPFPSNLWAGRPTIARFTGTDALSFTHTHFPLLTRCFQNMWSLCRRVNYFPRASQHTLELQQSCVCVCQCGHPKRISHTPSPAQSLVVFPTHTRPPPRTFSFSFFTVKILAQRLWTGLTP